MPTAKIEFTNIREVLAGIKARQEKLQSVPKVARQMGVLALNEIHPLTNKKTHNWDNSIHAEVHQLSSFKWELWVGSKGAFTGVANVISEAKATKTFTGDLKKNVRAAQKSGSGSGYNYGARQEKLYHPIDIGFHRAWPRMVDLWNQAIHGVASRTVSSGGDFGESMGDEFSMMGGF